MNRKHPQSRPFFTPRGAVVLVLGVILAALFGFLVANYVGLIP